MKQLRLLVICFVCLTLWVGPGETADTETEQYIIEFQIFVARNTKVVFKGRSITTDEELTSVGGILGMTIGDVQLDLDSDLMWDGEAEPPEGSGIEILAAPRVVTPAGATAKIRSGSVAVYLEQHDDNCYTRQVMPPDSSPGIFMEVLPTAGSEDEDGTETVDLDVKLRVATITDRKPVPGLPFDVGKPMVLTREVFSQYQYRLGRWNVITTHMTRDAASDRESLFVMVRVKKV